MLKIIFLSATVGMNSSQIKRAGTGSCCADDYLGTPYPLPVLAPEAAGTNLLNGVNYASAGAGILEETGSIFVR